MSEPLLRKRCVELCVCALVVAVAATFGVVQPLDAQTLEPGWTVRDLGVPVAPGTASFGSQSMAITSSGAGVSGTSDAFTFVHRKITGNAMVLARVQNITGDGASQVGVMVRESLKPHARDAFLFRSPTDGVVFSTRVVAAGLTTDDRESTSSPSIWEWLKIERVGDVLTVSVSGGGTSWLEVGSAIIPALTKSVYVGLAVASGGTAPAAAEFSKVMVIGSGTHDAGFVARGIGTAALYGGSWSEAGTVVLDGAGTGITGTADQFRFVSRAITGDMDIVARLAPFGANPSTARTGLMIRKGTGVGAAHWSLLVGPNRMVETARRTSTGGVTTVETNPYVSGPTWLKLTRRGTTVTAWRSSNGTAWTELAQHTMTDATYNVGLVVTSTDPNQRARAMFESVAVAANQAPTVALTNPLANITVAEPASLTLSADAHDADGTIASVDFYAGSTLLGTDTTSPYEMTWNIAAAGSYAITAVARDNDGATKTSAARTVLAVGNVTPTATLTAPANGTVLTQPPSMLLTAQASDADGPVASVAFYAGTALLGVDVTSPFSFTWQNPPVGTYAITAVAYDALGAAAVSEAALITIASAGAPTTAIFTPASIHAVVDRYVLEIFEAGSDPSVDEPVASVDLGRPVVIDNECRADVRATIAALPPGSYIAAVTAQSTQEGDFRSASSPVFAR